MRGLSEAAAYPRPRLPRLLAVLGAIALAGLAVDGRLFAMTEWLFVENGPVENSQLALIALAALAFLVAFLRAGHSVGLMNLVLTLGCVVLLSREVPRCDSLFFGGAGLCLPGRGKNGLVLAALLMTGAALLFKPSVRPQLPARSTLAVLARHALWGWPLAVTAVFLVAAEGAEQIHLFHSEEIVETVAYSYLAAVALWSACHARFLTRSVEERLGDLEGRPR